MEPLASNLQKLRIDVEQVVDKLQVPKLVQELDRLQKLNQEPDFWNDAARAQSVMKQIAKLEARIKPWQKLSASINDLMELLALNDKNMVKELEDLFKQAETKFKALKAELRFNGLYDDHDAIMTLMAGAGGTDAQDWTQMLLRMYSRYFEKNNWRITTFDESPGEEAGIKGITLQVEGNYAYGKLKGEHGVHRLVRLSPFNADHLRQTSFAKVEIAPKIAQPEEVEIDDKDLKIDVYRSGGHGGQSVNTTDSAVRVTHLPTGISVAIQNERSQLQNKETALTILRSKLAQLQLEQHAEKLSSLKGPSQSAEWGNQIRSYVLHPYKQVKDLRTKYQTSDPEAVLDGNIDGLITAYLESEFGLKN
ncbi:MAG TPA: peptide chain release factor 2 [Candidatus Dormibacteraeota bacterium]|nr:peptide chain release factor 2 [Candidatus Dormibacteraeota bacterium]